MADITAQGWDPVYGWADVGPWVQEFCIAKGWTDYTQVPTPFPYDEFFAWREQAHPELGGP